jgi:signal peptidase I
MGPHGSRHSDRSTSCITCLLNLILIVGLTAGTFIVVPSLVQVVRVQGDSMTPTLLDGQLLLISRLPYRFQSVQHGDIIIFKSVQDPETMLVKRVIGLPGESVSIRNGRLFIGSKSIPEPYVVDEGTGFGPTIVKPGTIFVMGDHRTVSNDSRAWGLLPEGNIMGRAELSIWPPRLVP